LLNENSSHAFFWRGIPYQEKTKHIIYPQRRPTIGIFIKSSTFAPDVFWSFNLRLLYGMDFSRQKVHPQAVCVDALTCWSMFFSLCRWVEESGLMGTRRAAPFGC